MINDIFNILLPQICIAIFIFVELLLSLFVSPRKYALARWVSATGIFSAIALLMMVQSEPQYFAMHNSIMSDSYTLLFHFIILLVGFFTVLLTKGLVSTIRKKAFSFHAIFLTAILGAMNIVSANDFITLFISLEMLSFSTYFLIASKDTLW